MFQEHGFGTCQEEKFTLGPLYQQSSKVQTHHGLYIPSLLKLHVFLVNNRLIGYWVFFLGLSTEGIQYCFWKGMYHLILKQILKLRALIILKSKCLHNMHHD